MTPDPERSALIIESQIVGDGRDSDETLGMLATEVRTMEPDAIAIGNRIKRRCHAFGVDGDTTQTIVSAIINNVDED
jgi:hypothetical protein